ncbi:hypothetical protein JS533_001735 [Bifidobacterium amazonense]|uniref:Uncharacterized protein n=1 Tax=Bifidobacterium amazonense TaxID=2809027 RepID=A0ABS9VSE9_9BIFI|nr:hypothetical protein [Bifidobacterium amazonense]MCH9275010.1 hypothetical protein [Bifidobacterium amazonense]
MQIRNLAPDPNGVTVNAWAGKESASPWKADTRGLLIVRAKTDGEAYMESALIPITGGTIYVFAGDISNTGDATTGSAQVFRPIWRDNNGTVVSNNNPFTGGANLSDRRAVGELTSPAGATTMTVRIHAPATEGKAYVMSRILVMAKTDYTALKLLGLDYFDGSTMLLNGGGGCRKPHPARRRVVALEWGLAA